MMMKIYAEDIRKPAKISRRNKYINRFIALQRFIFKKPESL